MYLPRKVHTWFACIACVRNATFPSPLNDHNNRLSVIGSYWSVRGFRVCIVACMRCSSFQAPAHPGPRAAHCHFVHPPLAIWNAVSLGFCPGLRQSPLCTPEPQVQRESGEWYFPVLMQPSVAVLSCFITTYRGAVFFCSVVVSDRWSRSPICYGDEESVFPSKAGWAAPSQHRRGPLPLLEMCRHLFTFSM